MSNIKFYIPKYETIPTELRLFVDDVCVLYKRIPKGFRFYINLDDDDKAIEVAKEIVSKIKSEHDEPNHGISWRTVSLGIIP